MSEDTPNGFEIGRLMMSLWVPQALHTAAELGVADVLAASPLPATAIADKLDTHPEATERLLEALCVLRLLERGDSGYRLLPLGEFLRSDVQGSRRAWARLMGGAEVWRAWGRLTECVKSGQAAYAVGENRRTETETFDALFADGEAASVFHQAMADGTTSQAQGIIQALELPAGARLVDVGGGFGALLCAALEQDPEARGEVFDLAHAKPGAEALFATRGLARRAGFVTGDLFEQPPPSADWLLLKSVIHDWSDERSRLILKNCRKAIEGGGRLAVIEPFALPAGSSVPPSFAWIMAFSDLNMLINTGGKERSREQFQALIESAGLVVERSLSCGGFYSALVCRAG